MNRSALFLLSTAGLLAPGNSAFAGPNLTDNVRVIQGAEFATVRPTAARPWKPIAKGQVPSGAELQCDKPCTVQVDPDNTVALTPGAIIKVDDYFYVPLVANAPSLTPAHRLELREGMIEAVSPSERALPLVVTTGPEEHVALRDGRAQIVARGDRTVASALRGSVRMGGSHSWLTLETGQAGAVRSHNKPTGPKAVLEAPKWQATEGSCPGGITVSRQDTRMPVGGCWQGIDGASAYQVELAQDSDFKRPVSIETTSAVSWSSSLGVGRYFVRVRAADADGIWGQPSTPHTLAVVSFMTPLGATANLDQRVFIVPQGREIAFGEIEGVELAIDGGGFAQAPKSLAMDQGPEHALRFRLKDDPTSTSAVYVARRRALTANVQMSPKKAYWPSDPVEIAVTIQDPSGQVEPTAFEPHLQVLLGLTELSLKWTHRGAVWSARIDPKPMGGPTVLRVIAQDEFGTPIGRNFLEIDQKRTTASSPNGDSPRVASK